MRTIFDDLLRKFYIGIICVFLVFSLRGQDIHDIPKWQRVTEHAAFSPRDGAGLLAFQDKLWVFGGWNKDSLPTRNNEVWNSPDGRNWTLVTKHAPWSERHCSGFVVYRDKIWLIGGDGCVDVWNSPDGINWTQVIDSAPWGPRYKPYVLVFHDRIWLMGGLDYFYGNYVPYNDVWYTTDGAEWTLATDSAGWAPRGIMHGSVVFDDKIWILGGGLYGKILHQVGEKYYNDVWCSADGINWTRVLEKSPWKPRIHHNIACFGNKIWVMAGHNRNQLVPGNTVLLNDVWYSANGIGWLKMPYTPWPPTHAASVIVYDSALWMIAGYLKNDVWKLYYPKPVDNIVPGGELRAELYPNPASDKLYCTIRTHMQENVDVTVRIFDNTGSLLYDFQTMVPTKKTEVLDLSHLAQGIYILNLTAGDMAYSAKFFMR